jgi:hypothetical protein
VRPTVKRFAELWLDQHIYAAPKGAVSASDLADRLVDAAINEGIPADELEDETDGLFEMVFEALASRPTLRPAH